MNLNIQRIVGLAVALVLFFSILAGGVTHGVEENNMKEEDKTECGLEAHRDTVGALNISFVYQGRTNEPTDRGSINRVMAHPEVVS